MTPNFKTLVAIQPEAPGHITIPNTRKELRRVAEIVQNDNLIKLGNGDAPSSVDNVLLHLPDVCIAHFACHGLQNMTNPLESALILDNGKELKISRLMETHMPKASLVFLSACCTAMGDMNLPDEAMHIAASMLFAGFRGAVATMW